MRISRYFKDAFGYEGNAEESSDKLVAFFEAFGVDMHFEGEASQAQIKEIEIETRFSLDEIIEMIKACLR